MSARLVNGRGGWFEPGKMVCHCLLIEGADGLILVDTGLGTDDVSDPRPRLGGPFLAATRPVLRPDQTALAQVLRLGFRREDVRHLVLTHLDLDHAGGLPDFPEATVHVFEPELRAATERATRGERGRYRPAHFAHGPKWKVYPVAGETWLGFDRVRILGDDVALIPTVGHTRGHCAVAVREGEGWLLHAGDAYFFHGEMQLTPRCTPALAAFQRFVAVDNRARLENQRRLRALSLEQQGVVRVFSAHDPTELELFAALEARPLTAGLRGPTFTGRGPQPPSVSEN